MGLKEKNFITIRFKINNIFSLSVINLPQNQITIE